MKPPTMKDVAREANVSVATVSRFINDPEEVSEKLQIRVQEAMSLLNYHPSSFARGFKMQETRLIGLIMPLLDHPFFSRLAQVMEQELFRNNYRVIISNTEEDETRELEYVEMMMRQRVDGVIINSAIENTDYLFQLQSQNIACVLIDRDVELFDCSKVFSDNSLGGYLGMKYLLELGHRNIKVVAPFNFAQPMQHRLRGIRQALAEFSVPEPSDMFLMSNDPSFEMGINAGKYLAQLDPLPTAIFALTDVTAVGVLHGLAQMGLTVPDDVSVMGYDGVPLSAYIMPSLTTIAQPITQMGIKAVEILLNQLRNPDLPSDRIVLPNQLLIRESTLPIDLDT
ncbi:MAG: substrate-binding domain-containing protein [Phototrophicaceae bacterium]